MKKTCNLCRWWDTEDNNYGECKLYNNGKLITGNEISCVNWKKKEQTK